MGRFNNFGLSDEEIKLVCAIGKLHIERTGGAGSADLMPNEIYKQMGYTSKMGKDEHKKIYDMLVKLLTPLSISYNFGKDWESEYSMCTQMLRCGLEYECDVKGAFMKLINVRVDEAPIIYFLLLYEAYNQQGLRE